MKIFIMDETKTRREKIKNLLSSYEILDFSSGNEPTQDVDLFLLHQSDAREHEKTYLSVENFIRTNRNKILIVYSGGIKGCEWTNNICEIKDEKLKKYICEFVTDYITHGSWHHGVLCRGKIAWVYEHSLEILHCSITPDGFESADKEFSELEKYIDSQSILDDKHPQVKEHLDKAKENFQILKERTSGSKTNLDIFGEFYVNSLKNLREELFALVDVCEKAGVK